MSDCGSEERPRRSTRTYWRRIAIVYVVTAVLLGGFRATWWHFRFWPDNALMVQYYARIVLYPERAIVAATRIEFGQSGSGPGWLVTSVYSVAYAVGGFVFAVPVLWLGCAAAPRRDSWRSAVAFYLTTVISLAIVRVMVMCAKYIPWERTRELEWVSRYCSWVLYPEFFLVDDRWFQGGVPPSCFALVTIGCLVWAVPLVMFYRLRAKTQR